MECIRKLAGDSSSDIRPFQLSYVHSSDTSLVGDKLIVMRQNNAGVLGSKEFHIARLDSNYLLGTGPNGAKGVCTVWGYDVDAYWIEAQAFGKDGVYLKETQIKLDRHEGNLAGLVVGTSLILAKTAEHLSGINKTEELMTAVDYFVEQILNK